MPNFCNRCSDVVNIGKEKFNWKIFFIVFGIVGAIAGGGSLAIYANGIFFLLAFLIFGAIGGNIYRNMWKKKPLRCLECGSTNYYYIKPHEAESLRRQNESGRRQDEQAEMMRTMMDRQIQLK